MTAAIDLTQVSEADWAKARDRLAVIRRLAKATERTREDVAQAASQIGCSVSSTYDLLARYLAAPQLTSLLPQQRGRKQGKSMLVPEVAAIINQVTEDMYLTRQKPRVSDLVAQVHIRCRAAGLALPSRGAIERRLSARPASEVTAQRHGRKAARDRFAPTTGSLEAPWPLSLVQIDHTLVDVIVVDSQTREPIQRPWLTLAIDVCTRCVAGLHLSLEPPSATSVALCISQAALPKDAWLAERGIDGAWPVHGIPERLHLDNAKEFRSEALRRGCEQHGIAIDHRPVRTPHYGGHIERLIGTMMGKVHLLPGTTFSNVQAKGDLDPSKSAVMTLEEVERWLGHAIAGVYHREVHRGLGMPPLVAWEKGISGDDQVLGRGSPTTVSDPRRFLIDFLPIARRLVRRDGVSLHSIGYWSDVLSTWIGHAEPMIVRFDPRDLSRIYLLGPDGTYYDLTYRDLRRPPISLWEHRAALKRLREQGHAHVDEAAIFRAVQAMREIADQAAHTSKTARRQKERRRMVQQKQAVVAPAASAPVETNDLPANGQQPHEQMFPFEEWN
ncbi:DDE-type integrase/transposase/recombinase [Pseudomonas sp. S5(2021)]|jgi:putative transposase|nr:Integrase, catalytic region [Acidovorax sp. JS42]MBZ5757619.1 DDE-type integrase/transposase/recombinase [Pseudomonas sp. S5(2021)]HCF3149514.1 transposase [Pseudomonas aeruginosa]ABM41563.1 Integrase, catalytic region [Acidovorax sp. JS42]ABM42801.1 Integrase, catalytic region [Acidovorax sp. JS42]